MVFQYFLPEKLSVDMCINLGSRYLLMPQHLLDSPQVGTAFQQMGRKRMPERMRTDIFMNACHLRLLLDNMKNHDTGKSRAPATQE